MSLFRAKRLNPVQLEKFAELEETYPPDKIIEVAKWAVLNNMNMGRAIASMKTALPKWGKPKQYNNGKPVEEKKYYQNLSHVPIRGEMVEMPLLSDPQWRAKYAAITQLQIEEAEEKKHEKDMVA